MHLCYTALKSHKSAHTKTDEVCVLHVDLSGKRQLFNSKEIYNALLHQITRKFT